MDALSSWVTRHRMIVGLLWLAITIVGVLLAPSVSGRLKSGNHLHSAAYTADVQIAKQYGGATSDPGVLTLNLPARQTVQSPGVQAELKAVDAGLSKAAPTVRIVSYASTGSRTLLGTGGTSTIVLAYPPKTGEDIDTASLDTLTHAAAASAPHGTDGDHRPRDEADKANPPAVAGSAFRQQRAAVHSRVPVTIADISTCHPL
jgi:RND superfamily putative drug exporter